MKPAFPGGLSLNFERFRSGPKKAVSHGFDIYGQNGKGHFKDFALSKTGNHEKACTALPFSAKALASGTDFGYSDQHGQELFKNQRLLSVKQLRANIHFTTKV
jgi:hypothetical protein